MVSELDYIFFRKQITSISWRIFPCASQTCHASSVSRIFRAWTYRVCNTRTHSRDRDGDHSVHGGENQLLQLPHPLSSLLYLRGGGVRDNREVDNRVEDNRVEDNHHVEDKQQVDNHTEEEEQDMHKELHSHDDRDYYNHDDREVGSVHLHILLSGGRILCRCDYADPPPFSSSNLDLRLVDHKEAEETLEMLLIKNAP